MLHKIARFWKRRKKTKQKNVNPDEIFLDSSNLPSFNKDQFEGRIVTPIPLFSLKTLRYIFLVIALVFIYRAWDLQIVQGSFYASRATNNNLKKEVIFAHRGIIADRNDVPLAWNEEKEGVTYDNRKYILENGFAHLLGFVKYPGKDAAGNFYSHSIIGQDGVEGFLNERLSGRNGAMLTEVSVKGEIESQSTLEPPINGDRINLSIDSRIEAELFRQLRSAVENSGFVGGAGVIMDTVTGEVIAIASYPDYDSNIVTEGKDKAKISEFLTSKNRPFLDRAISGLYAPGSIVKPFVALGILEENIIDPNKEIYTEGFLSLPNPYDPENPTIFKDWKNHGLVDLRRAIAVSSDVYFYIMGGGFGGQKGLGITKIDEYVSKFLFGVPTEGFFVGPTGTIPTPEWKKKNFNGEDWRVGNTYHTSIGQYGFQVTPLQMARATTGIANDGTLVEPVIIKGEQGKQIKVEDIKKENYKIVKEGMRMAVTDATAIALNIDGVTVAAKTGTAELGYAKSRVNSWVVGFFPYEKPRYVFSIVLENGPTTYKVSAMQTMAKTLTWIRDNASEYVKSN